MATSNITAYLSEHTNCVFERDTTASFLPLFNSSNASKSLHLPVQGDRTCVIDSDVSMGEAAKTSLISRGLQKPDVILFKNINDESHPVVLIEVESSSSVLNTVNKLANGIMCQIIHLRNTGHTTNTLTGFFIPLNPGNAEEVTVTFDESLLRFDCTRNPMTRARIIPAIIEAWNNQKRILPLQRSLRRIFPISSD